MDSSIEVTADIPVTSQLDVNYTVTMFSPASGAAFVLGKTQGFSGSLLRVTGGGSLTLRNLILDGAQAGNYLENSANRSLVQVAGGSLRLLTGTVLRRNSSYGEGGGVSLSGDASYVNTLVMDDDARITGCASRTSGGGLMASLGNPGDDAVLRGSALIDHNSAANGGGVCFRSCLARVGGILAVGNNVRIENNAASADGGGINISGFPEGGGQRIELLLSGSAALTGNTAAQGGGIYFYSANSGDRLALIGQPRVSGNTASGGGGGIFLVAPSGAANLSVNGGWVTGNIGGAGGGICLRSFYGGQVNLSGAQVTGNMAVDGASGSGGGLCLQNASTSNPFIVVTSETNISGNGASGQGGGLYLTAGAEGCLLDMTNTILSRNSAMGNGGGILMSCSGNADVTMTGGNIDDNTSEGAGGGFYFANTAPVSSQMLLSGVTVVGNSAAAEGGGLRFTAGSGTLAATITDCTLSANTAGGSGGGIWNGGGTDLLLIQGNTVISCNNSESGNGGGIYFHSESGLLTLADAVKVLCNRAGAQPGENGNHGGGVSVAQGRVIIQGEVEIACNSALSHGGGLSSDENSYVEMAGGSIHDNVSQRDGGGVWNHGESRFLLLGGEVYANAARVGGGIYNAAGSFLDISRDGQLGVTLPNEASGHAPGIFQAGSFHTQGHRDHSNGLYLDNRSAAARLDGPLTAGSVIQLNHSGYVSPNAEGIAIVAAESTSSYPQLSQADADAFRKPPEGFEGWEIGLSGDGRQVLLARASYSIRYENLMGTTNPNPTSYTSQTPDIVLAAPGPLTGHRFVGWFDAPEGGSSITVIPRGSAGDLVLYARWEAAPAACRTVTYCANSCSCEPVSRIPCPVQVDDGGSLTLSCQLPQRNGYRFMGWNSRPTGTGIVLRPGQNISNVTSNLCLYAQWEPDPCSFVPPCRWPRRIV